METTTRGRCVRFGPFEVDLRNRELRRQGLRLRVQRQPFAVLEALLEEPGMLVTRESLRLRLWPDGTFVEFDKGLNTAVMKLREVLGEDPHAPHFIETVAREGYRFVAAVEAVSPAVSPTSLEDRGGTSTADDAVPSPARPPPVRAQREQARSGWTAPAWLVVVAVLATAVIATLLARPRSAPSSGHPLRFAIREPPGVTFSTSGGFMALSPDGRAIAFVASDADGVDRLWLQPLDSLAATELPGTEGAGHPFWSPDSIAIAFFADTRLKRLVLASGSPRTLGAVSPSGFGGAWSTTGTMLYALGRGATSARHRGLILGSADGGAGSALPPPTGVDPDAYLSWPRFLHDGRSYLFLAQSRDRERSGIYAASLDGGPVDRVSPVTSSVEYANERIFYVDHGVLLAQPFDATRRRTIGPAVPIADGVPVNARTGRAAFSVSAAAGGIVAYRQALRSRLEWFDRKGSSLGMVGSPDLYRDFSVAPDGERVAAAVLDPDTGTHDIWILGTDGALNRFTSSSASEIGPQWSADGTRIAYASDVGGRWQVLVKSVTEGREPQKVAEADGPIAPTGWGGSVLFIGRLNRNLEVTLPPEAGGELAAEASMGILDTPSPDRRWRAHRFDDTTTRVATAALYLDAVPPARGRWQIAASGSQPRWRADGSELYYMTEDRRLMAIRLNPGGAPQLTTAEPLFQTAGVEPSGLEGRSYDVSPDGQRFLVKVPAEPAVIVVIANWTSLLDRNDDGERASSSR